MWIKRCCSAIKVYILIEHSLIHYIAWSCICSYMLNQILNTYWTAKYFCSYLSWWHYTLKDCHGPSNFFPLLLAMPPVNNGACKKKMFCRYPVLRRLLGDRPQYLTTASSSQAAAKIKLEARYIKNSDPCDTLLPCFISSVRSVNHFLSWCHFWYGKPLSDNIFRFFLLSLVALSKHQTGEWEPWRWRETRAAWVSLSFWKNDCWIGETLEWGENSCDYAESRIG